MDYERERGRVAGLKTRRMETMDWARTFIEPLNQARSELPAYADTGKPSQSAYADWLNAHGVTTRREGRWTSESVARLFGVHAGLIDQAENEFKITMALIRENRKRGGGDLRAEEAEARQDRQRAISEAQKLTADLQGVEFIETVVPELFQPPVRKRRPKQLSLFTLPD